MTSYSPSTTRRRIEVVAAVLQRADASFLLAQRPADKIYAGYWEFPGGKVEPGESAPAALGRELHEELGINVTCAYPWITRDYDYDHAAVRLKFYRVTEWSGELHGRESQRFEWQRISEITVSPLLPANGPVLRALALPPLYGISNATQVGGAVFLERLESALDRGLKLIQIREKSLSDDALVDLAKRVVERARAHGASVLLNAPRSLAARAGADGVHLTSSRLMRTPARPDCERVGASCHDERELAHAAAIGVDFVVVGPVAKTVSHPGAPALGWKRLSELIADYPVPVYGIGGLGADDLGTAWAAGAHGIAAIRGAWLPRQ